MFENYLKVAIRNFLKRKLFTLINILGLAVGMAICLAVVLFVQHEYSYDNFHENGDRVYRVATERKYTGRKAYYASTPASIGQAIQQEFPEVLESTRVQNLASYGGFVIRIGDKDFEENSVLAVDSNYFKVFSGNFLQGNAATAFMRPNDVVVNESTAKKYFGSASNAFGKSIFVVGDVNYMITGVCRDWPETSHLQFNLLFSTVGDPNLRDLNYFDFSVYTYLLLKKNASPVALESKFPQLIDKYVAGNVEKTFGVSYKQFIAEGNGYRYFLQPLQSIHLFSDTEYDLRPNGSIRMVHMFQMIAGFILLLACINFINLSTAVSAERAKEVGIRKALGTQKFSLVSQFLLESLSVSFTAVIVAVLLLFALLPLFNRISGIELSIAHLINPDGILFLAVLSLVVGLLAGLYPAFIISSFKPVAVLKGRFKTSRYGMTLRNGLVIFQFAISIILIICTIVVNQQMQYMMGNNLGFNKDHVIAIEKSFFLETHRNAFKAELSKINGVETTSDCSSLPGGRGFKTLAFQVVGTNVSRTEKSVFADYEYLNLLGLQVKEGRFFSKDFGTDSLALILNEKAVEEMGLKDPLGTKIKYLETFLNGPPNTPPYIYTVVGVIKDFHFQSFHNKVAPLVLINNRIAWADLIAVRVKAENLNTFTQRIGGIWKHFIPEHQFHYSFLDTTVAEQYIKEQTMLKIFTLFSLLAILIACIGLFGLATYATLQRNREISIRKVLGASGSNIVTILSRDFLKLVIISALVAFPVAWWAMHTWLQDFAYRINIKWWVFLLAAAISIVIAFATISYQAIKAANANPIKSLRTE